MKRNVPKVFSKLSYVFIKKLSRDTCPEFNTLVQH